MPDPKEDLPPLRTGQNVDAGIESGAVTVDPATAQGVAAQASRDALGAKSTTEDGVKISKSKLDDGDPRVADNPVVEEAKQTAQELEDSRKAAAKK